MCKITKMLTKFSPQSAGGNNYILLHHRWFDLGASSGLKEIPESTYSIVSYILLSYGQLSMSCFVPFIVSFVKRRKTLVKLSKPRSTTEKAS